MKVLATAIEMNLGELAGTLWARRRLLGGLALAAGLVTLVVTQLLPPRYHSVASILPSKGFLQEQQIVLEHGTLNQPVQLRPTTASNSQNIVTGASHALRGAIVDSLDLVDFFGHAELAEKRPSRAKQRAAEDLKQATHFELSIYRDVLFIHVITRDAAMSARIANLYVDLIEAENRRLYKAQAGELESYLRGQRDLIRERRLALADSLASLMASHGVSEIDQERDAMLSLIEELRHQRIALELALSRERLDRLPDDPQIRRLSNQLRLYDETLERFEPYGKARKSSSVPAALEPSFALNVEALQSRLETLTKLESDLEVQLSASVMEQNRDEMLLPVMDRAFPADEPYGPNRWLLVLGAAFMVPAVVSLGLIYVHAWRALAAQGRL